MIHEFGSNSFIFRQCVKTLRYIPNEVPNPQSIHSDVYVFMDKFFNFCMLCWWMDDLDGSASLTDISPLLHFKNHSTLHFYCFLSNGKF
jgi:hypothetical protein